jgi:hypothetical protein
VSVIIIVVINNTRVHSSRHVLIVSNPRARLRWRHPKIARGTKLKTLGLLRILHTRTCRAVEFSVFIKRRYKVVYKFNFLNVNAKRTRQKSPMEILSIGVV